MSRPFQIFIFILIFAGGLFLVSFSRQKKEQEKMVEAKPEVLVTSINQSNARASSVGQEYHLRVISDPDQAELWVDGEKKSSTPFEFVIGPSPQKLSLKLPGYQAYERMIPAAKDAEGDLVWKIQLKKSAIADNSFLHSEESAWLLQLRSVSAAELDKSLADWATQQNAKLCRATVEGEDRIKVVRGPFAKKALAEKELRVAKKRFADAFIERIKCGE